MYHVLREHISKIIELTDDEWADLRSCFSPMSLQKREFLLQAGEVCHSLAFIEKGALYACSADGQGSSTVIQFAFEGHGIGDISSFLTGEQSRRNIEALEDCELLLFPRENWDGIFERVPRFERYTRILMQNAFVALQRRIDGTVGRSAEERYAYLVGAYPELTTRVPQHLIASFLGISRETLSRIRRQGRF